MSDYTVAVAAMFMCMVGSFALFGFLAVVSWADARRREREAFYRGEVLKKIAETPQPGANAAIELFREHERAAARRQREGLKLGGLITLGVGVGLWVFLMNVEGHNQAHFVALIPMLVGLALLVYVFVMAPKEKA